LLLISVLIIHFPLGRMLVVDIGWPLAVNPSADTFSDWLKPLL
jgi:hypothetical protein